MPLSSLRVTSYSSVTLAGSCPGFAVSGGAVAAGCAQRRSQQGHRPDHRNHHRCTCHRHRPTSSFSRTHARVRDWERRGPRAHSRRGWVRQFLSRRRDSQRLRFGATPSSHVPRYMVLPHDYRLRPRRALHARRSREAPGRRASSSCATRASSRPGSPSASEGARAAGLAVSVFDKVDPNPVEPNIFDGVAAYKAHGADLRRLRRRGLAARHGQAHRAPGTHDRPLASTTTRSTAARTSRRTSRRLSPSPRRRARGARSAARAS